MNGLLAPRILGIFFPVWVQNVTKLVYSLALKPLPTRVARGGHLLDAAQVRTAFTIFVSQKWNFSAGVAEVLGRRGLLRTPSPGYVVREAHACR